MFVSFFHELKSAGVPVTLREYLTLVEAMEADLAGRRVEDFYYLSRATLVKDERNLDKFDRVFGHVFKGLDMVSDAVEAEIPVEWLKKLTDRFFTEEEKKQIEGLRQEVAKVKALQPGATGTALGAPASYWLDLRGYSPPEAAKALNRPMLVLQGERDYQVTLDNFETWKKALGDRKDVTFKSYPRLNHLFIEGEGKSGPAEYQKPGHVAEAVVADIAGWIKGPAAAKP